MHTNQTKRQSESGNVLFLILIAVALFAALSYVVSQSTRSGGGSTEREKSVLSSAQMTQYPTSLRTAVVRMVLAGTPVGNIVFNPPSDFNTVPTTWLLFQTPNGGGANYQAPAQELSLLDWKFNGLFDVPGIGTTGATGSNDLIAFLPGVSSGVCSQVNKQLNITNTTTCTGMSNGVPAIVAGVTDAEIHTNTTATGTTINNPMPNTNTGGTLQGQGCTNIFERQASGCFYLSGLTDGNSNTMPADQQYVFYSVLLER